MQALRVLVAIGIPLLDLATCPRRALTADWLIGELGLRRRGVARRGPMGTVLLGDTQAGRLRIQGYAGNSAPDHVDLPHALPDWPRMRE